MVVNGIIFVTCLAVLINSEIRCDPVSFIKKCKSSDAKCTKESAQAAIPTFTAGIPELGVKTLDPLPIDKIDASNAGLRFIITDALITGVKGCLVKRMQRDVEKAKLYVKVQCDLGIDGQYEMNGRLLIIPIEGNGKLHVFLRKIVISVECDTADKDGKDGKKHWTIKKYTHSFELKDKADVVFENLFNGNEILGRTAKELIANNGNDVVLELGPNVVTGVLIKVIPIINNFFHSVPAEDLTLDN